MNGAGVLGLVAFACSLVLLLAWVGWRYFRLAAPLADPALKPPQTVRASGVAHAEGRSVGAQRFVACLRDGARSLLFVVLVGGVAVGAVFGWSTYIVPDPLSAGEMDRQAHIQAALNPEKLVPPPALPPSMFMGLERPALESADRDWSRLDQRFASQVLAIFERLRERGYAFALLEGYRSPERQDMLAGMGSHVTNARAFQSKHQFGLAVDVAPLREGRLLVSERDPWAMQAYVALGEEAERSGLSWGGRWWMKDYGHIEARVARR